MQLLKLTDQKPAKFYGLASDWSILTIAKPMHPAIGCGVPQAHRETQGWRLSLGIILPCVKMCRRSQATQGNFQCHNDVGSLYTQETTTAQLKSHYRFPGCLVILTEDSDTFKSLGKGVL